MHTLKTIRLLSLSLLLFVIVGQDNLSAQALGANYNERIDEIDNTLLDRSDAEWSRGFVNIIKLLNINNNGVITGVNQSAINSLSALQKLKNTTNVSVGGKKVKLILSLKYDFKFKNVGVPTINSNEVKHIVAATKQVLAKDNIGSVVDILVVGNEPMFETVDGQAERLRKLTIRLIDQVAEARDLPNRPKWNYDIYIGALNRASQLGPNREVFKKLMVIAKNNNKVKGLDVHIHVNSMGEIDADLRYIRNNQGFNKAIIVTEFSLQRLFANHLNDRLGAWGPPNGFDADKKVYEWINQLLRRTEQGLPVSQDKFLSFFNAQSWYPKNWFRTYYRKFCRYNVKVATYGLVRPLERPAFQLQSNSPAWVLNALYNESLFGKNEFNGVKTNPIVHPDYKKIIDGSVNCSNARTAAGDGKVGAIIPEKVVPIARIYPNPAASKITIARPDTQEVYQVELIDAAGKIVHRSTHTQAATTIDLGATPGAGTYLVRIKDGSSIRTERLVVE